jgi:valyl-tRNA synthetase
VEELSAVALPVEPDPYGAAVEVLREVRKMKSEAKVSMKASLKNLEIVGSTDALAAVRSVLGDLLAVTNASAAVLNEGTVEEGLFTIRATLESATAAS